MKDGVKYVNREKELGEKRVKKHEKISAKCINTILGVIREAIASVK